MKNLFCPAILQGRPAIGLLLVRLVLGSAFILHGSGKIIHPFTWMGPTIPVAGFIQALAAIAEFFGGFGIILGFLTPLSGLGIVATMTVAILAVHLPAHHPFVSKDPMKMAFELPLIYWASAALLALSGPGSFSLDALLFNRKGCPFSKPSVQP